jgi:orotate phosphoribosyltransferase
MRTYTHELPDSLRAVSDRIDTGASPGGRTSSCTASPLDPFALDSVMHTPGAGEWIGPAPATTLEPVTSTSPDRAERTERRLRLLDVVRERGLLQFPEPRELASGELSCDFIDGKRALSRGRDLLLACQVIADSIALLGIDYSAVGGLTLGADQFAHGIAVHLADDREWFVVRKQAKERGTNKLVEGAELSETSRVLLVDDIVTTGGSIQQAYHQVRDTGAEVVAAVTLVDRGEVARAFFEGVRVPYQPVFTYRDFGIRPVGGGSSLATAPSG